MFEKPESENKTLPSINRNESGGRGAGEETRISTGQEEQGRKDSRSTFPGGTGVDTCFLPPGCSLGRGSESRVEGEGVRCQEGVQLPGKTKEEASASYSERVDPRAHLQGLCTRVCPELCGSEMLAGEALTLPPRTLFHSLAATTSPGEV